MCQMIHRSLRNTFMLCVKTVTALQITHTTVYMLLCPYSYVRWITRSKVHAPSEIIIINKLITIRTNIQWETGIVFPGINRPVSGANLSAQPKSSHLHFTSLLYVLIFTETLRMYAKLPFLERKCWSDYELPASTGTGKITLPAGTGVYIPVLELHFDAT
jgi:hypothetical protein